MNEQLPTTVLNTVTAIVDDYKIAVNKRQQQLQEHKLKRRKRKFENYKSSERTNEREGIKRFYVFLAIENHSTKFNLSSNFWFLFHPIRFFVVI